MVYGYVRVSTKEQNLDRQVSVVEKYKPLDEIFADKQSGKDFERPEYQRLKYIVSAGDEVVIKELDRLGRNKDAIKEEIQWFKDEGVRLRILDVPTTLLDFGEQDWIGDMLNNILIEVLGAVAQNEREEIRRRQREGIDAMIYDKNGKRVSSRTGRPMGRGLFHIPKQVCEADILKFMNGETTLTAIAKKHEMTTPTLKRIWRDHGLM